MAHSPGFFDLDNRYAALSETGEPLERVSAVVDFEMFRPALDTALQRSDRTKGGRPPMDAVMMVKVLVLQSLYGLADELDRIPDQGSAQFHAVSRTGSAGSRPGRADDLAIP